MLITSWRQADFTTHNPMITRRTGLSRNDLTEFHLLWYACRYWHVHTVCSGDIFEKLLSFLTYKLTVSPSWLSTWVSVRPPPFLARPLPLHGHRPFLRGHRPFSHGHHPTIVCMLHDTSIYSQPKCYSRTQSPSTISLAYAHKLIPMS